MSRRRRNGRRAGNPREIPPWVIQLALYGGGAFLAYKVISDLVAKLKKPADDASKALARAIVGPSQIKVAEGITYVLPTGARVSARLTTPAGGAYFTYTGIRYKIVEATPPGSGVYRAERA